jgi:hypothetical protein
MSDPFDDHKKRPPPILIPPVPQQTAATHIMRTKTSEHEQPLQQPATMRNAPSSTQQGPHSASPPLTSPLEHDVSRYPLPKSGSQRSRTAAMTNLTGLMQQARSSPQKSDQGIRSTTQSKHSALSRQSANSVYAQLDTPERDERTSRGKIEARTEMHMFKMSGQVPPTPIAGVC